MPASEPTILATSGGLIAGRRTAFAFGPLMHLATELAQVTGRRARWCHLGTASGDQRWQNALLSEAAESAGVEMSHLNLFPMPSVADLRAHVLSQDVIWVGGGSVANLLALWRLHGLDAVFAEAWEERVVLAGVSAGSICWHVGGATDSFGPPVRVVTNGLGLLPYSNGVHYDSEVERRPTFQKLIKEGALPEGFAVDDGVGLIYRGTILVEAVSEIEGKGAYHVRREGDGVVEEPIVPRLLPEASATNTQRTRLGAPR